MKHYRCNYIVMGCVSSKNLQLQNHFNKHSDTPFLMQTIEEHKGGINCVEISSDSSLLVSGGEDCTARLWSTHSTPSECIGILVGHEGYITCCAINDHLVITGSADSTIRVWDICSAQCVAILRGHQSFVNHVIWKGKFIISSSYDCTAKVWSVFDHINQNNGFCLKTLKGHTKSVTHVALIVENERSFSEGKIHDLDLIVTTSTDSTVRTWLLLTGECHKILRGHNGSVNCVAVDPNNKTQIYTAGADYVIKCWDCITGDLIRELKGHEDTILCLLAQNRILYSGSCDRTARAWAMEFGECTRIYWKNAGSVTCVRYLDGILYTGSCDASARVYDSKSGTLLRICLAHTNAISSLQAVTGKMFTCSYDGKICVWDCSDLNNDTNLNGRHTKPNNSHNNEKADSDNVVFAVTALEPYIAHYN